jgi:hypothetical protein
MFRTAAAIILALGLSTLPAYAAGEDSAPRIVLTLPVVRTPTRPAALPLLYAGLVGLQAYDVYSTRTALGRGASEANPLMGGVAGNTAGLVVAKAVSTAGIIFISERLWKKNRVAAILTVAVANGIMAGVAMNNARVLNQQH